MIDPQPRGSTASRSRPTGAVSRTGGLAEALSRGGRPARGIDPRPGDGLSRLGPVDGAGPDRLRPREPDPRDLAGGRALGRGGDRRHRALRLPEPGQQLPRLPGGIPRRARRARPHHPGRARPGGRAGARRGAPTDGLPRPSISCRRWTNATSSRTSRPPWRPRRSSSASPRTAEPGGVPPTGEGADGAAGEARRGACGATTSPLRCPTNRFREPGPPMSENAPAEAPSPIHLRPVDRRRTSPALVAAHRPAEAPERGIRPAAQGAGGRARRAPRRSCAPTSRIRRASSCAAEGVGPDRDQVVGRRPGSGPRAEVLPPGARGGHPRHLPAPALPAARASASSS